MSNQSVPAEIKCHLCKRDTAHELRYSDRKEGQLYNDYDEQRSGNWWVKSELWQCLGCREFTILRIYNDTEGDYPDAKFYPPREEVQKRLPPSWSNSLPDGVESLLEEVYSALQTRSCRLAAMGLRALLEALMTETLGDVGGFEEKVRKMLSEGLLSKVQKAVLEPTLELGHAATHRGHVPSRSQLEAALGIVEGMLHLFYVQSKVVDKLKAGIKPRQRAKAGGRPGSQKGRKGGADSEGGRSS